MIRNNVDEDQVGQWSAQVEHLDKTMQSKKSKSMSSARSAPPLPSSLSSSVSRSPSSPAAPAPAAAVGSAAAAPVPSSSSSSSSATGFRGLFQRLKDTVGGSANAAPATAALLNPVYDYAAADAVSANSVASVEQQQQHESEQARPRRASYDDEGYAAINMVSNINNRALFK